VGEHLPLFHPEPVAGKTVMIVAAIGIAINGFTAYLFASGRKDDLNIRGAYLHNERRRRRVGRRRGRGACYPLDRMALA